MVPICGARLGEDAALVRASIVDGEGRLCSAASHAISFAIASGPGRVLGVGNGDPSSHEPNVASARRAYHGLARAVVQVTVDAVGPGLATRAFIDVDAPAGGGAAVGDIVVAPPDHSGPRTFVQALTIDLLKLLMESFSAWLYGGWSSGLRFLRSQVVKASAPGLAAGEVSIPVSTDRGASVLAVAARSVDVEMQLG